MMCEVDVNNVHGGRAMFSLASSSFRDLSSQ
jgi:hypothetical protein